MDTVDILQEELAELQELVPGSRENEYETILTFDSSLKKNKTAHRKHQMLFNTSLLSQRIYFTPLAFVSIFFTLFRLQEAFIWEIPPLTRHWQSLAVILLRIACLDGICDSCLLWNLKYHLFLGLFIKHKKTFNDITFRCGKVKNHKSHKPTSLISQFVSVLQHAMRRGGGGAQHLRASFFPSLPCFWP